MTASATPARSVNAPHDSIWSRVYGLGSVFAKTVRDSRRSVLVAAALMGGVIFAVGAAIPRAYPTQAARDEMAKVATDLGAVAQGLAGKPVNVATMGGYVQWKYGPIFLFIAALWSILALSATLAGEARNGSLEFVAASPMRKRSIALQKVAAHLAVMTIPLVVMAFAIWLAGATLGTLPGDSVPIQAAVGYSLWVGLLALAFGGLAFALAQVLGRAAAAGIAGGVLFAGWVFNGYVASVPAFAVPADLTPWAWTANHLPLAGQYDWITLVPVAVLAVALLALGVEGFARRDLGAASSIRTPGLPAATHGLRGPTARALGERLPSALAWGLGMGVFGLAMAGASGSLADQFANAPDLEKTFSNIFPNFNIGTAGGFLQLLVELMFIVAGFASATMVSGWASDESSGRLEMLLATPLARGSWAIRSGLGVLIAIAVMTAILAAGIGIGAWAAGSDFVTPMSGSIVLGIYAAALAGVGFAVGGFRSSIAAEVVVAFAAATYLVDLLAPALQLPNWIDQVALTSHLGRPMVGVWDPAGVVACLAIAALGLLIGGYGMRRRDIVR
jgi:ABC-2 type transport system permease protein